MNPPNDPVTTRQPNPGQFMNPQGNNPGGGSALLQLLRLKAMGGNVPGQTANAGNPQGIQMSQPPQGVGGLPPTQQNGSVTSLSSPPPPATPSNPQQAAMAGQTPPTTPDDNLTIALQALGNYIKGHAEAHMARNGVPQAKAQAQAIAARNPQQGAQ